MPIEHAIWKVGVKPTKLYESTLDSEKLLEDMIVQDLSILNDQWLLIGRQVTTDFNKSIDLLAIDGSGSVIVIELKKKKTPREVVAQVIDYASWVKHLDSSDLAEIYEKYLHDDEFTVETEQGTRDFLSLDLNGNYHREQIDNDDKAEYIVAVDWLRSVPIHEAKSEVGFFGNQNEEVGRLWLLSHILKSVWKIFCFREEIHGYSGYAFRCFFVVNRAVGHAYGEDPSRRPSLEN